MKAAGRLALGVLAWAALIPLAGVIGMWLDRSVFHSAGATRVIAHAIEGMLILAAALVYWRCVPSAPNWGRRVIYLVGFVVLLVVASAVVTFGVQLLIAMLVTFRR